MINVQNLSLNFENVTIFQNANISIPKDKMTVFIGPNGVGKTTLLKVISKLVKPNSGSVLTNAREIFYLPQRIKYPQGITLQEYVESSFYKKSWKWVLNFDEKKKVADVLELLELSSRKDTLIDNLSSGELQKANIALGLISDADVLLLDEPTSNMDLVNQIKILELIKKLTNNGITCILVLHDINLAAKYGDYFIGFTKNYEIVQKNKNEFFNAEILNRIYGINFKVVNDEGNIHVQISN